MQSTIRTILSHSHNWVDWARSIDATVGLINLNRKIKNLNVIYCVDTSEIVEFIIPSSRFNRRLNISLQAIFEYGPPVCMLPAHALEIRGLRYTWHERLTIAEERLALLQVAMDHLHQSLDDVNDDDEDITDQIVEICLRESPSTFGCWLGPSPEGFDDYYSALLQKIKFPLLSELGLEHWHYEERNDEIDSWYREISESPALGGPSTHLLDAHALDFLDAINHELDDNRVVILLTHSQKIWSALRKRRKENPALLKKGDVSLVQSPDVAFVRLNWLNSLTRLNSNTTQNKALLIEQGVSNGMMNLRDRLEKQLKHIESGGVLTKQMVDRPLQEMTDRLKVLDEKSHEWERNVLLQLQLKQPTTQIAHRGLFNSFREAIQRCDRRQLKEILSQNIISLMKSISDIRDRLALSIPPRPTGEFRVEVVQTSSALRWVLRRQPVTFPHMFVFPSESEMGSVLHRIEELLDIHRENRDDATLQELHKIMNLCETNLNDNVENYLLLASVYTSRGLWFQALNSATQGFKKLWPDGKPEDEKHVRAQIGVLTCELLLARCVSLRTWTSVTHGDLAKVAASFLETAAGWANSYLQLRQQWWKDIRQSYGVDSSDDARGLRELAVIYGLATELNVKIEIPESILLEAKLTSHSSNKQLKLAIYYAQRAYDSSKYGSDLKLFCTNNLLYELSELNQNRDIDLREKLATELASDSEKIQQVAQFTDTLGRHHYRMAEYNLDQNNKSLALSHIDSAINMFNQAVNNCDQSNRYAHKLFKRHKADAVELHNIVKARTLN